MHIGSWPFIAFKSSIEVNPVSTKDKNVETWMTAGGPWRMEKREEERSVLRKDL